MKKSQTEHAFIGKDKDSYVLYESLSLPYFPINKLPFFQALSLQCSYFFLSNLILVTQPQVDLL
jgi:hypothetical protein